MQDFCRARDVALDYITTLRKFEWIEALTGVTGQFMLSYHETQSFLTMASVMERLFKAIHPDQRANEFGELREAMATVIG